MFIYNCLCAFKQSTGISINIRIESLLVFPILINYHLKHFSCSSFFSVNSHSDSETLAFTICHCSRNSSISVYMCTLVSVSALIIHSAVKEKYQTLTSSFMSFQSYRLISFPKLLKSMPCLSTSFIKVVLYICNKIRCFFNILQHILTFPDLNFYFACFLWVSTNVFTITVLHRILSSPQMCFLFRYPPITLHAWQSLIFLPSQQFCFLQKFI